MLSTKEQKSNQLRCFIVTNYPLEGSLSNQNNIATALPIDGQGLVRTKRKAQKSKQNSLFHPVTFIAEV